MQTSLRMSVWRVLAVALVVPFVSQCATAKDGKSPDTEKTSMESVVAPDGFEKVVVDNGGRVDFVFGEERPFPECHASSVVQALDGSLLCCWFGGEKEKNPDVGVWLSKLADGAWSAPERVAKVNDEDGAPIAHWNPVLFNDPKRGVYLFFKVGVDVPHWTTYWMMSTDSGKTWSDPVELVPGDIGGRGPVKNPPTILSDGTWLAPASTELDGWKPFADRSEDGGKTWVRTDDFAIDKKVIKGVGAIQPTFWEAEPGKVYCLMRTAGGCVAGTHSEDGGKTWAPVYATELPNNNSGLCATRLDDGRVYLVYNPVSKNWGPRTPLTLAVTKDDGKTWTKLAHFETEPGEYSYPTIVNTDKGVVVSYTWKRERVRCWDIPVAALDALEK